GGRGGPVRPAEGKKQAVVVDQAAAAKDIARIQLEVLVFVAHCAPVQNPVVGGVGLVEHPVEGNRLARSRLEHPGDVVGPAVRMADDTASPAFAGHAALGSPTRVAKLSAELNGGVP